MGAAQSSEADLLGAATRGDEEKLAALLPAPAPSPSASTSASTSASPSASHPPSNSASNSGDGLPPLDSVDENGRTALVLIVRAENLTADAKATWVARLVQLGADVNRRDRREWTVLHHAAHRGLAPVVEALIAHKADAQAREIFGRTPRQLAETSKSSNAAACVGLLAPAEAADAARNPFAFGLVVSGSVRQGDRLAVQFRAKPDHADSDYLQIYVTVPGGWNLMPRMGAFTYVSPGGDGIVELATTNIDVGTSFRVLYVLAQDQRAVVASDIITVLPPAPRSPWGDDDSVDPSLRPNLADEVAIADQALANAGANRSSPAVRPSSASPTATATEVKPPVPAAAVETKLPVPAAAVETKPAAPAVAETKPAAAVTAEAKPIAAAVAAASVAQAAATATAVFSKPVPDLPAPGADGPAKLRTAPWLLTSVEIADNTLRTQTSHRLRQRTFALAGERELLLAPPPTPEQFPFVLNEWIAVARTALREDPVLERVRFQLVPTLVTDEHFWSNYFFHALRVREEELGAARAVLGIVSPGGAKHEPYVYPPLVNRNPIPSVRVVGATSVSASTPAAGSTPAPATAPAPAPAPAPTPAAGSTPAPAPAPASGPAPGPVPAPAPAPAPTSAPGPASAPGPTPDPAPGATPAPGPASALEAAKEPLSSTAAAEAPAGWTMETFKQPVPKEYVVDLEARAEEAVAALQTNEQLAALRFRLVPGRMTEEAFWRIYFYRQGQLSGNGSAPAVPQ